MCTRIAVNTTPFDSGLVTISHYPPGVGTKITSRLVKENYMKLPHASIDLGEQTAAELRVPFYSPLRFIEVAKIQTANYLGFFQISDPFDCIFSSNSTLVNVYMWIEDVELIYPTNISGTGYKVWSPQGPEKRNPSGVDVVLSQDKIDNNYQISRQTVPYAMNCVSKSYKSGTTNSFEELFQTPDFIRQTVLTKNAVMGVSKLLVSPCIGDNEFSRLGSVSNFFYMYAGSIDIKMKLLKTQFHSGRLQIAFFPLWPSATALPTSWDDFWNIIWDFSEKSEIEFSIPYVDNKFMTLTYLPASQGILAYRQITPLQCPDNVAQNISLVVTGNMSSDLKLACPKTTSNIKTAPPFFDDQPVVTDSYNVKLCDIVEEMEWEPQGPPSIADKDSPTPENYVNEGTCSLSDFAQKFTDRVGIVPFSYANGIVFPSTLLTSRFNYEIGAVAISNLNLLASMFEFYRGDLMTLAPSTDYYQILQGVGESSGADTPNTQFIVPYISNLRYNSVLPKAFLTADYDQKNRLHNAEFFLPWYSTPHRKDG